jgi:hypothetical protein
MPSARSPGINFAGASASAGDTVMSHFSSHGVLRMLPVFLLCLSAIGCKPSPEKVSGPGSTSEIHPAASVPAASNPQ